MISMPTERAPSTVAADFNTRGAPQKRRAIKAGMAQDKSNTALRDRFVERNVGTRAPQGQ
jgi:hypothetical protein